MEAVTNFIFLGSKITSDSDCSCDINRCLLLERKAKKNLESRDITLPTKVHLVKAVIFAVFIYRCESWTIKNVEHQRIDIFKLSCWRWRLRVPWTTGRSNQSILKGINPKYSLKGMLLKLKLQYFGQLIWRANWLQRPCCWERLKAKREEGSRGYDG